MSIKDLISAAINKDASTFESTFADIMQAKVSAALEARFSPVAEEFDLEESKHEEDDEEEDEEDEDEDEDEDMKEEADQIDEISDDKLRSYHAAAGADRMKAKAEVEKGMAAKKFTPASAQKTSDSYKRFVKRGKGMTTAANKMSE